MEVNAHTRIRRDQLGQFLGKLTKQERQRQRTEAKIQTAFVQWCRLCLPRDVLWFSVPNERKPQDMGDLMAMGLRPGAADMCVLHAGKPHFIEFKAPDGTQSEAQQRFEQDAYRAGAKYAVCRSSQQARDTLSAWGIPHREKPA